jgi:hypothetical protein
VLDVAISVSIHLLTVLSTVLSIPFSAAAKIQVSARSARTRTIRDFVIRQLTHFRRSKEGSSGFIGVASDQMDLT